MTIQEAIILGIIQGLTEFLPISSSGHLVLFQHLFGFKEPMLAFDIAVHCGTLLAVFVYFAKDLLQIFLQSFLFLIRWPFVRDRKQLFEKYPYALTGGFILLASIPTFIIAFVLLEGFEFFFGSILSVGIAWMGMGVLLLVSRRFQEGDRPLNLLNHRDAFLIGIVQGISIMPGISRSGATILTGMACGMNKEAAAKFSFWIAIPAILGAAIFKMEEGMHWVTSQAPLLLAGFGAATLTGFLAIYFLLNLLRRGKLFIFGYYCLAMGLFTVIYRFLPVSFS